MTTKSKVPQIRFKGFSGEWEKNRLKELTEILRCGIAATPQYVDDGVVFLSSQNVTNSGKINLEKFNYISEEYYKKISKNAKLLKGDILYTRVGAGFGNSTVFPYDGDYGVYVSLTHIRTNKNLNNKFLNHLLNSPICKEQAENGVFQGGGVPNLNVKIVENFNIVYPKTENEQIKIGDYFQQIDILIEQKEKKYQKLKQFKKAMLDKMFPKNGADTPKIRFKGFSGKWKEKSLDELCLIITKQTGFDYSATIKPSLVNYESNDTYSFIQNKDFDGTNINLQTDFYIPKNIAENFPRILIDQPSILITISGKIGNVGLYSLSNKAFIGGAVGICKLINYADGLTILYNLLSQKGQSYFKSLVKASSHSNITVEDIRKIKVQIPIEKEEQEKIGSYFQKLDKQIDLQQKELEKLKNIKKASLSKMFV